ncbi:MAG: ATP-binding protein [Eubacteriaceae bacterium]|nr:ATP-binding protein [Eubacteriaceae bacterium]
MDEIKLTLPTKIEYISLARLTIASVANGMGFSIEDVEDLKVAVSEACANVIMHSVTPQKSYELIYTIGEKSLIFSVVDKGIGFVPEKETNRELKELELTNGFGLIIIKMLMDEVKIQSEEGLGSTITMVKNLHVNDAL